jgi:hypothetical protein
MTDKSLFLFGYVNKFSVYCYRLIVVRKVENWIPKNEFFYCHFFVVFVVDHSGCVVIPYTHTHTHTVVMFVVGLMQ